LAIGADGVHLGQTDMPINVARSLLPKNTIIGVSCNNVEDIRNAVRDGADYVGIGAVWGTSTKVLTSPIVGVRSVGIMLNALEGTQIKAVAIGNQYASTKSSISMLYTQVASNPRTSYEHSTAVYRQQIAPSTASLLYPR
jgi:thiamine-phosphate diphosphorylase/hydroxyethylthiazole kinase